jgi:hypothetical protein
LKYGLLVELEVLRAYAAGERVNDIAARFGAVSRTTAIGTAQHVHDFRILNCMRDSTTTIRVSPGTRDAVRDLADTDGLTLDEEIQRLTRAERQRRLGAALAADPDEYDSAWLSATADSVVVNAPG